MITTDDPLAGRTVSAFPVSIGTSLALETLAKNGGPLPPYDPDRIKPPPADIARYQEFWVNLHTLFRNIVGAMGNNAINEVLPGDVAEAMEFEAQVIREFIRNESQGRCRVVFYASEYKGLDKAHPFAKLRVASTDLQKNQQLVAELSLNAFMAKQAKGEVEVYERALRPTRFVKALIMTHFAYDLLSAGSFADLELLESHTGAIKNRALWYTKLTGGKDLVRIPFSAWAMQWWGDSQTFSAQSMTWRKQVLAAAEEYKLNQSSTLDRVIFVFERLGDKSLTALLKQMALEQRKAF